MGYYYWFDNLFNNVKSVVIIDLAIPLVSFFVFWLILSIAVYITNKISSRVFKWIIFLIGLGLVTVISMFINYSTIPSIGAGYVPLPDFPPKTETPKGS